ncbi:MAG TPA: tetratricopeptide repeat protein [Alphaproteobacteria bacterium]
MTAPAAAAAVSDGYRRALHAHRAGRLQDAAGLYAECLSAAPERADIAHLLGLSLLGLGDFAGGVAALQLSLSLDPEAAAVEHDLANALVSLGHAEAALDHFDRALALDPGLVDAQVNRATALAKLGRHGEAAPALEAALVLAPRHAEALYRLGRVRAAARERAGAIAAYQACLAVAPDHAEARYHLGDMQLAAGDFAAGWANYEARFHRPGNAVPMRPFAAPRWDGQPLAGRCLLVWGEQGVGEEILFASRFADLAGLGGRIVVECDPRLVPLFERSFPGVEAVGRRTPPDPRIAALAPDIQTPSGSLGRWLCAERAAFRPRPYLVADADRIAAARARHEALGPGLKVGIAWRSVGPNARYGRAKSTALADWAPLLATPGARFESLQYGDCAREIADLGATCGATVHRDPAVDQAASLDDFAAQVAALDLVVTTSNTTAHMAGALGVETWVLLPPAVDWRWQGAGEGSLWYPRARLFRRAPSEDWSAPIDAAVRLLAARTNG